MVLFLIIRKATHSAGFVIFRKYFVVHVKLNKLAM